MIRQKAEPLTNRCLALRTRGGRLKRLFCPMGTLPTNLSADLLLIPYNVMWFHSGFPGAEICAETTVMVTSNQQNFYWNGYGLKLYIPEGSLPANMEYCTIKIMASLAGQYEFPENSHLVSAVYWLRCEPGPVASSQNHYLWRSSIVPDQRMYPSWALWEHIALKRSSLTHSNGWMLALPIAHLMVSLNCKASQE